MATVIDRLVVELGLDPKQFTKGQKEAAASIVKTRETAQKHGAGIEKSMDGAAEAVDKLARNALKLFAIFTAGRAIGAFTADITAADAALGRLAKSIGSTPEVISSLGSAVARNGGSATAAAGSFERLADSINEIKTTGNSSILPYLYRLQGLGGKQINLNKEMSETFGDLAENAKNIADKQGIPFATYLLKQAGVDRDTAALLVQGRQAYNKALAESRKIGIVRKEDTEAAQKLQTVMEELRQTSEGFGRTVLTALTPTISDLLTRMREWITANQDWIKTDIVEKVRQFATWLKSIDWDSVGKGLRDFGNGALKVADTFGGLLKICEALFLFWVGSKAVSIVAGILKVAGLLSAGPLGWAIRLAMGASIAADLAVPNAEKPGVITRSDDENSGAAVGPSGGHADGNIARDRGIVRDYAGRAYRGVKRLFGGGSADAAEGGAGIRTRANRAVQADKANYNFTGDNASVVKQAAAELGTSPKDLATVISYETGGKFSPSIKGGKGGNYQGLIQFGPSERAKYGVTGKETFAEQMPMVVRYLKDRGFKPGMGLNQLYATINGGNPYVSQNASDGNGTIATHVEKMRSTHGARVERFLNSGNPAAAAPPDSDAAAKAAATSRRPEVLADPSDERRKPAEATVAEVIAAVRTVKSEQRERAQGTLAERAAAGYEYGPQTPYPGGRSLKQMNEQNWPNRDGNQPTDWKRDKDTGNWKPVFGDAKPSAAINAQRAGAMAAIQQARSAQAATVASTSNDNRSTSSTETNINGPINIHTNATDASGIARDIGPQMKRHAFAAAANYARA